MALSATKTVQIARPAAESYAFIADPQNMPRWAIHNVTGIRKLDGDRWEMDTPRGKATLIPRYDPRTGILDHAFIDAGEGVWNVTGRVVPVTPSESVYIMTLPKPDRMPAEAFEAGMRLMDDELAALKACIESDQAAQPEITTSPRGDTAPVQTVEALYEAFRRRDLPAIFELLSPDIEVIQSDQLPWGGHFRGHDGARRFFGLLGSHLDSKLSLERLIDSGDHVAAVGWTEGTVKATHASYRVPLVHVWQVRNGRITRAQFFIDHPTMRKAIGG